MARAAVPGRLGTRLRWLEARLTGRHDESDTARTLVFDVPGWPGHLPGQHVDVRLTAEDGYSTQRSYSIASASDGERVELTVERIDDGEVSPYLVDVLEVGRSNCADRWAAGSCGGPTSRRNRCCSSRAAPDWCR
jgi:NAD(P)H-flavin reductase